MFRSSTTKLNRRSLLYRLLALGLCLLTLAAAVFASRARTRTTINEEADIRALLARWVDAYENLDAKNLAALEMPNVQVVDRFGELHLPSGRTQNEKLWEDAFEAVEKSTSRPAVTVDCIRFLQTDVAVVHMSWEFPEGIALVGGDHIPPFSQADTYVVMKSQTGWLIAAHNMQEKKP